MKNLGGIEDQADRDPAQTHIVSGQQTELWDALCVPRKGHHVTRACFSCPGSPENYSSTDAGGNQVHI